MTGWNSQQGGGKYAIQFETDDRDLYKLVEKACQIAMDQEELSKLRRVHRELMEIDHLHIDADEGASCEALCGSCDNNGWDMHRCGECKQKGHKFYREAKHEQS